MTISVLCITYNHGKYIEQCLKSILMQETDFDFEVVVGDDASSDDTLEVCRRVAESSSRAIAVLDTATNMGFQKNFVRTLKACRGAFIAICEGDDFWTDSNKLQRQVSFLRENPEYSLTFHNAEERYERGGKASFLYCGPNLSTTLTTVDLAFQNLIPTCSVVFRNRLFPEFPGWFFLSPVCDWPLHVFNSLHGKIHYDSRVMGVHRLHSDGVWGLNSHESNVKKLLGVYENLIDYLGKYPHLREAFSKGREALANSIAVSRERPKRSVWFHVRPFVKRVLRKIGLLPKSQARDESRYLVNRGSILTPAFHIRLDVPSDRIFTRIGVDSVLSCTFVFESPEGEIIVGDRSHIGTATVICRNRVEIGDDVYIAWGVTIYDHDSHSLDYQQRARDAATELEAARRGVSPSPMKDWSSVNSHPIRIGNRVWIGMNSIILKGVELGEGVIVGAGSVVTKSVPPWTVVAGNPAREVKKLVAQP